VFITTFYSFKGGVGRTLAMVNVAVALSQVGRRVLLVDFDLEAPGLDTFSVLTPPRPQAGLVEYISEFRASLTAPSVRPYIYEVEDAVRGEGRLWVMPSGKGDEAYRRHLEGINWRELYEKFNGYLLFEDLKAQWQELYQPDYVLIDSRTGYTEVQGICTRQLPDAVAILFFPNDQNLAGLRQVVPEIRAEAENPRAKKIQIHFVMSNVPDLDDEDAILNKRMGEFRKNLGYEELTATIHRYDSLALLDQVIFTHARPKSRLSREYLALKDAIVAENIEDREGAIRYLKSGFHPGGLEFRQNRDEVEKRLDFIEDRHSEDGKILFLLAMVRKAEQRLEDALVLLDRAIARDAPRGESLVERADIRHKLNIDTSGAISDIKSVLGLPALRLPTVERAVQMLRKFDVEALAVVSTSPAVRAFPPDDRLAVADMLTWGRAGLSSSLEIATSVATDPAAGVVTKASARFARVLALIGLGHFAEAMDLLISSNPHLDEMSLPDAFNYAMAEWGKAGHPSLDSFARALKKSKDEERTRGDKANFHECLAVAFWAVGDIPAADAQLLLAEEAITKWNRPAFSCWRYYTATLNEFLADCAAIRKLIKGEPIRPLFWPTG
jgi:MinD-like ATPase involved in chromosome partitioning or flagellar assembly